MNKILQIKNMSKSYILPGKKELKILENVNLEVEQGQSIAIIGESGCGKSTLLQIAASLLKPTSGQIILEGKELENVLENDLCKIRNEKMGFIFQNSLLLEDFSAFENIMMPLLIGKNKKNSEKRAQKLIEQVNLVERKNHNIYELSGGERQRIAIARALSNHPEIIFADEPTGSLDEKNATYIEDLLLSLVKEEKVTLILVTHNMNFAKKCDVVYKLTYGNIERL